MGTTEKWEKPQAARTFILDGFSTRDEHCICNLIPLRTAETRQNNTNVSVTRHLPLLTSLCCSVFYCRCRCCLLFLTQPVLVVVGAVEVTGLKNPFNNLLQCFIWENGTGKHQHHLSPHHLLLLSFPKTAGTLSDPFAGKMLLPQASPWSLLVQDFFPYLVTVNKSINNPLPFRKTWRARRILRVHITLWKICGVLHSEVKFMNFLFLLLQTIIVIQFLTKWLSVQTNVHRYHLIHEGSSPEVKWLKRAFVSKKHLPSVPQMNAGAS